MSATSAFAARKLSIKALLLSDNLAVEKAILALYSKQTENEKVADVTNVDNGMGFTGADAYILTQFAKFILNGAWKNDGERLTDGQRTLARKKLPKYAGQLARIADERKAQKANAAQLDAIAA